MTKLTVTFVLVDSGAHLGSTTVQIQLTFILGDHCVLTAWYLSTKKCYPVIVGIGGNQSGPLMFLFLVNLSSLNIYTTQNMLMTSHFFHITIVSLTGTLLLSYYYSLKSIFELIHF